MKGEKMFDVCPECKEYSLTFNSDMELAICHTCGFTREMSKDDYIVEYADKDRYVVLPERILRKLRENGSEVVVNY
jgi:acetyl-CoA carboxylase beta subunit